jgi:hypothetical protein
MHGDDVMATARDVSQIAGLRQLAPGRVHVGTAEKASQGL